MGGPGSSTERQLEHGLHVAIAIIPIIALGLRGLYWPAPARPFQPSHFGVWLSPQPGLAQARQFVQALVRAMQIILHWHFCCQYSSMLRQWPRQSAPWHTGQQSVPCWLSVCFELKGGGRKGKGDTE